MTNEDRLCIHVNLYGEKSECEQSLGIAVKSQIRLFRDQDLKSLCKPISDRLMYQCYLSRSL